jgi:hypothetical protein
MLLGAINANAILFGGSRGHSHSYTPTQIQSESDTLGLEGKYVEIGQIGYGGRTHARQGLILNETKNTILIRVENENPRKCCDYWERTNYTTRINKGSLLYTTEITRDTIMKTPGASAIVVAIVLLLTRKMRKREN